MQIIYCKQCGHILNSNGTDKKGRKRWRCRSCGKSFSASHPKMSQTNWRKRYEKYLLDKTTLHELAGELKIDDSTLRRQFDKFENISYKPETIDITGKPLIIDGLFNCGQVTLIAIGSPQEVYNWDFVDRENTANWSRLLSSLQGIPLGIVGDGQKGMFKAVQQIFPGVPLQRCQSHVIGYICTRLGKKPQEFAQKYLRALAKYISSVRNLKACFHRFHFFDIWKRNYESLALEKISYINQNGRKCWRFRYTHLHEAYAHLKAALPYLFNYLFFPELPNTTNDLEGGINSPIRELLRAHRGTKLDTQKQIISLFLRSK